MTKHRWRFIRWRGDIYLQIATGVKEYPSELKDLCSEQTAFIGEFYDVYDIPDKAVFGRREINNNGVTDGSA